MLLTLEADENTWAEQAECRGRHSVLFFGPNRFEPKRERLDREDAAKAICARCPALAECREFAMNNNELFGIWGGTTEAERRAGFQAAAG